MNKFYKTNSGSYKAKFKHLKTWLLIEINTRKPFSFPLICSTILLPDFEVWHEITAEEFEKAFTVAQTMQREAVNHYKQVITETNAK